MDKVLYLWLSKEAFYPQKIKDRGTDIDQVYKDIPFFSKMIRRILIILNLPIPYRWIGDWKYRINNYKQIIIHSSILNVPIIKLISKKNKNARIIVWFWNPVSKKHNPDTYPRDKCELWSFDIDDCNKHNLNFNTQYYFKDIPITISDPTYDLLFVGADKGRIEQLIDLKNRASLTNLNTHLHITKSSKSQRKFNEYYKPSIPYEEVLTNISLSRAIIDLVAEGQSGLTIRSLEAFYFQKKLITNNTNIVDYDFYDKQNVFILGVDEYQNLSEFIKSDFVPKALHVSEKYDYNKWLNRFSN